MSGRGDVGTTGGYVVPGSTNAEESLEVQVYNLQTYRVSREIVSHTFHLRGLGPGRGRQERH